MNFKPIKYFVFLLTSTLVACGQSSVDVHSHTYVEGSVESETTVSVTSPGYTEVVVTTETVPSPPELLMFDLVDSYGFSGQFDPDVALAINPYEDDGWFEIYWEANAWDDYWVEFYVNDRPDWEDAVYFGSQMCGAGFPCDAEGMQFCQYDLDFGLSCDTGENLIADISPLIYAIPQTLYVFLQVCDLDFNYCEYDYYPVLFE